MNKKVMLVLSAATNKCTISLTRVDGRVFTSPECEPPKRHSQLILKMIDDLLFQAAVRLDEIEVIVFYGGPGAFTGLRLGASIAQGLAVAHNIKLLSLSTLEALALDAYLKHGGDQFFVALDARKNEAYIAKYRVVGGQIATIDEPKLLSLEDLRCQQEEAGIKVGSAWELIDVSCDATTELTAESLAQLAELKINAGIQMMDPSRSDLIYVRNNVTG